MQVDGNLIQIDPGPIGPAASSSSTVENIMQFLRSLSRRWVSYRPWEVLHRRPHTYRLGSQLQWYRPQVVLKWICLVVLKWLYGLVWWKEAACVSVGISWAAVLSASGWFGPVSTWADWWGNLPSGVRAKTGEKVKKRWISGCVGLQVRSWVYYVPKERIIELHVPPDYTIGRAIWCTSSSSV